MSDAGAGVQYEYGGLRLQGLSVAGIRTAVSLPDYSLSFDVALGFEFTMRMKKFFITHGHLDHAAGIPYIISQKSMRHEPPPVFYLPPSLEEPLSKIMDLWGEIEAHKYQAKFHRIGPDSRIELNPQAFIRPFPTVHRIESFGYTLFSRKKKLKPEHRDRSGEEIRDLARQGAPIYDWVETPQISFTGDTQIEFLDRSPWVADSKILVCECTYLDDRRSVDKAREWGHTHLDELIPRLDQIRSEKILLIHLSSRYSDQEARRILMSKIPTAHQDRVELFPGR